MFKRKRKRARNTGHVVPMIVNTGDKSDGYKYFHRGCIYEYIPFMDLTNKV